MCEGVGDIGTTKRRQAGEGGISEYQIKAGRRFLIKYPVLREDGSKRVILKRGFLTRRAAAAAFRAEIRKAETGEWGSAVEASAQRLPGRVARRAEIGAGDVGQLPEEHPSARGAVARGDTAGTTDGHGGGLMDAHLGGGGEGGRSGWLVTPHGALHLHHPPVSTC